MWQWRGDTLLVRQADEHECFRSQLMYCLLPKAQTRSEQRWGVAAHHDHSIIDNPVWSPKNRGHCLRRDTSLNPCNHVYNYSELSTDVTTMIH